MATPAADAPEEDEEEREIVFKDDENTETLSFHRSGSISFVTINNNKIIPCAMCFSKFNFHVIVKKNIYILIVKLKA